MGWEKFERLVDEIGTEAVASMSHSELERFLGQRGKELLRALLQDALDARAPAEAAEEVRDAEGDERKVVRIHDRKLETVFGTVTVNRLGYGVRWKESLHPLDAELNLPPERYSLELRRRTAEEAAKSSFDETIATVARTTGARLPKRQAEELVTRAAVDFDAFYETRRMAPAPEPEPRKLVVLSSDGKGVVMRRKDLREATRRAAERRTRKLSTRLSKGEKRNAKRMATVATVYSILPHVRTPDEVARVMAPIHEMEKRDRPRPENKRVWASLEQAPMKVLEEAFREASHRDPHHRRNWVALVDGDKTQIRNLKTLARRNDVDLTIVLDIIHVIEYLWKAAHALNDEGTPKLEAWVQERVLYILQGRSAHVAAGMRRSATLRQLSDAARGPVDKCADYLHTYKEHLAYDAYLEAGYPIATGVIEGACRHLVKDRMDLTGARWSLTGAEAVLRLRALRCSGDFEEYWDFHEAQEHQRNHAAHYEAGRVPATKKPSRGTTAGNVQRVK